MDRWNRRKTGTVTVKRLDERAEAPVLDQGFMTLSSCQEATLMPGAIEPIRTGVELTPPAGYAGLASAAESIAAFGVRISSGTALIRPGEEAGFLFTNDGAYPYHIHRGDPVAVVRFIQTPKLDLTAEGW